MQRLLTLGAKAVSLGPLQPSITRLCGGVSVRKASTYKAAVLREFGQKLQIEDVKRKKLGRNQVSTSIVHVVLQW